MKPYKVSAVTDVFRAEGFGGSGSSVSGVSGVDPMLASQWQMLSGGGGTMYNMQNYMYNYMSWNTLLQMRNTISTDLANWYDKSSEKLYINVSYDVPKMITIAYIPKYEDVSQIKSDYWVDMLMRLAVATAKVTLGRVRSRYTVTNALWTQDGETMLQEGNDELTAIRAELLENSALSYGID